MGVSDIPQSPHPAADILGLLESVSPMSTQYWQKDHVTAANVSIFPKASPRSLQRFIKRVCKKTTRK